MTTFIIALALLNAIFGGINLLGFYDTDSKSYLLISLANFVVAAALLIAL